jgi:hypothetical protein|tara:strand:- start:682 stop:1212 length:531 start_codon:yes stop_codon:yes gene_type:complete
MGLDNMPHDYPCKTQGTALMERITLHDGSTDERIDCNSTIEAGGCPYTNANPPGGQVVGMMGTHCWYRGKYGNFLINALNSDSTNIHDIDSYITDGDSTFYGTDPDGTYRPAQECLDLAHEMETSLLKRGGKLSFINATDYKNGEPTEDDLTDEVEFAIWYLRWVAKECNGMDAWY